MSCLDVKKTMKLKELKELTQAKLLKIYGIEESRSIFHLLLNEFLGIDVINFHINGDKKISLDSLNLFNEKISLIEKEIPCLLYTSPSPRDVGISRMPSSA